MSFRRLAAALVLLVLAGCQSSPPPIVLAADPAEPRVPVVLIPGITGTRLVDAETGRVLWGTSTAALLPHDGGYSIALPVPGAERTEPQAVAEEVLLGVRYMGFRIEAYSSLVRLMEANGYRFGNLREPKPSDSFFLFAYDFRHSTPMIAAELAEQLEGLRRVRGEEVLAVHLVCQSGGARIGRYLVRFGGAPLEDAEEGRAGPPAGIDVRRLVMVGTANGGALRVLRELHRGRRYIAVWGRKFQTEVFFTYRSLYEELPVADDDLFYDRLGRPVEVDLFDAATWAKYGWTAFSPEAQRRIERRRPSWLPERPQMMGYLSDVLDRGQRLANLLFSDRGTVATTGLYLIQNQDIPTPRRAVLVHEHGRWRTYFGGDPQMERFDLPVPSLVDGDEHATASSQLHLSARELAALRRPPLMVDGGHFAMILEPEAQRRLLECLVE